MPEIADGPASGPVDTEGRSSLRLSSVIPACNQQTTIRQAIHEAADALSASVSAYEIIVVDDGSADGTAELVRAEAAANLRVRLVQHPRHLGYGASLRTGSQNATLDVVAFTDVDCCLDRGLLSQLL